MLGHSYYQMERLKDARDAFGKGYEAYPEDPDVLLNYAVLTYEAEEFVKAGELFVRLYRMKEHAEGKLLFQGAVAYYQGEKLKDAKWLLAELLKRDEEADPRWYELIIAICVELEEWRDVERYIDDFLVLKPAQATYWRLRAQMRLDKEQYRDAASALEIAYRIEAPKPREWLDLADLYLYLNAPLMAVRCMKAGHEGAMPAKAHMRISQAYARTQRFDDALKHMDEALKKDSNADVLMEKGRLLYDATRYKEAIEVLEECVRMDKEKGEAYMLMGFAAWNLRDWEGARTAFANASRVPQHRANALDGVAVMDDIIASIEDNEY
jgi:cytochrome c-type biogenesis protein CcmH/NrfG